MLAANWQIDFTFESYITTPIFVVCEIQYHSLHMQSDVDKITLKCQWFVWGTFSLFFC